MEKPENSNTEKPKAPQPDPPPVPSIEYRSGGGDGSITLGFFIVIILIVYAFMASCKKDDLGISDGRRDVYVNSHFDDVNFIYDQNWLKEKPISMKVADITVSHGIDTVVVTFFRK